MKFKLNSKFFGMMLIGVVVIAVGGIILLYLNDPKVKFVKLINKEYGSFKETIEEVFNSKVNTLSKDSTLSVNNTFDFDLKINETNMGTSFNAIRDVINTLTMNFNYASDNAKGNAIIEFNSKFGANTLFSGSMYKSGDKTYYYLTDIYDKYIESSDVKLNDSSAINADDTLYITNKIESSFVNALKTSDFTSESKTITINNEKVNTNKLTLTLTDARVKEIIKTIFTDIKDDTKCISILSKYTNADVKKSIEESIKSIDEETLLIETLKIDMYVKDNSIMQLDIYSGGSKALEYLSYKSSVTNTVKDLTIYYNGSVLAKAYFEKKSVNDIFYELSIQSNVLVATGNVLTSSKEVVKDKEWNLETSFTTSIKASNMEIGSLTINSTTSTKIGEIVKLPDLSNSIKESDITAEEQTTISNKIMDRLTKALPASITDYTANDSTSY